MIRYLTLITANKTGKNVFLFTKLYIQNMPNDKYKNVKKDT